MPFLPILKLGNSQRKNRCCCCCYNMPLCNWEFLIEISHWFPAAGSCMTGLCQSAAYQPHPHDFTLLLNYHLNGISKLERQWIAFYILKRGPISFFTIAIEIAFVLTLILLHLRSCWPQFLLFLFFFLQSNIEFPLCSTELRCSFGYNQSSNPFNGLSLRFIVFPQVRAFQFFFLFSY